MADRTKEVSPYTLKDCPFCGNVAKLCVNDQMSDSARWFFHVECTGCGICGRSAHTYDYINGHTAIVDEWNERHGEQKLRDQIESIIDDMIYNDASYDSVRASLGNLLAVKETQQPR